MTTRELDALYVAPTYARFPVTFVSGEGSVVYDDAGKRYIDMGSGIAVNAFGIADREWVRAVTEQLGKLQHMSNLYYTDPCAKLAEQLCLRTGMKKVFFGNSGAEANECAIKVARKYAAEKKGPEFSTVITLKQSFHGRTLTTLAATGQDRFHALFQPLTPGFAYAEPNDIGDMERLVRENGTAGILVECIQGEGGVNVLDDGYLRALEALAHENDILLMVDEVQTGNGRTGELYAYMHAGIRPDVVSTAKGLAGGLPMGACLLGEKAQNVFGPGDHGSTFGGNPVCAAGALNVLSRIDDELLASVREKSARLVGRLTGAPGVRGVTGRGFMLGIEPEKLPAAEAARRCLDRGVICLTAKNKLRLLPALNIPAELLDQAADVILDVLAG